MIIKRILFTILIYCSISSFFTPVASAQNMTTVNVDQLSDEQIRQFLKQIEATGMGEAQLEQVALAKGMSQAEITKLKARVAKLGQNAAVPAGAPEANTGRENNFTATENKSPAKKVDADVKKVVSAIFGSALFSNANITFEPNLRIPTPKNYQIGPDDQVVITVTGNQLVEWKPQVTPEGNINIPTVGFLNVNGLTIDQATAKIKNKLIANKYNIGNGTFLQVTLGNVRSIKVTITGNGATKPGTYTLSSLATVFNALYASGGPSSNGSFRNIALIRNNQVIKTLDVYNFLLNGIQQDNITLKDQDVINIPTYVKRVELSGEVKQPATFEVLPQETLADVLNFAGGFTNYAYTARIKVLQVTDKERRITDVGQTAFKDYEPQRGDKYFVEPILERFTNRVVIKGAVFRPGQFELVPGLTLAQLIKKTEGLKEDAFTSRAYITRLKADNTTELISFNLAGIMDGTTPDINLQREDDIFIPSIFELKDEYKVSISGGVRAGGAFPFDEQMTLQDAILKAGGFVNGASMQRIEISRRIQDNDVTSKTGILAEIFTLDIDKDLSVKAANFKLMPFDAIIVRSLPGYEAQRFVKIEGEVLYPGSYAIERKDEKISDLVKRAGGLTALANQAGGSLKRPTATKVKIKNIINDAEETQEKIAKQQRLAENLKDSRDMLDQQKFLDNVFIDINLTEILEQPNSKWDLILEEGDVLRVPKQLQVVTIAGEVLYPTAKLFEKGLGFKQYINHAGGFMQTAAKRKAYVIYPNGSVSSTKKFLLFNNYPKIKPGAEIIIPKQPAREGLTSQAWVGITTTIATTAAIIVTLLRP